MGPSNPRDVYGNPTSLEISHTRILRQGRMVDEAFGGEEPTTPGVATLSTSSDHAVGGFPIYRYLMGDPCSKDCNIRLH